MSINKVLISGNLTRDPELRSTASGMPVMSFGMAVNDRRKNPQTGEWEDHPNWVDCTMFGSRAEGVSRYISKGSKVAVEGKLRYSSYEKNGMKISKLEVIVDEIEFMSGQQQPQPQYQQAPQPQQYQQPQQCQPQQYQPQQVAQQVQQTVAAVQQQYQPPLATDDIPF